jgi:hypothetical protein
LFYNIEGECYEDYKATVCQSGDGNILMGTTIADTAIGNSPISRTNVVKLDNDGNIIWNKKYGSSSLDNFLKNIRCLEDGNIICTGSVLKHPPWNSGWILKLDSNGDSLWYRLYNYYFGEGSFNNLDDIIQTEDSGFLACGGLFPIPPDTGIQSAWGIKLDSYGCEWEGCDSTVGIEEDDKKVGLYDGKRCGLEVWPNPASSVLSVKCLGLSGFEDCSLEIYDIFGREVYMNKIPDGQDTVQVNVSGYSQGVYITILKKGYDIMGSRKFVVVK